MTFRNGDSEFSWKIQQLYDKVSTTGQVRILDVISTRISPQGGVWVAVKHDREVLAVLLTLSNQPKHVTTKLLWRETEGVDVCEDCTLKTASGDLLVYLIAVMSFDIKRLLKDELRILDIGDHEFPLQLMQNSDLITLHPLVGNVSLMIHRPTKYRYRVGISHEVGKEAVTINYQDRKEAVTVYIHSPKSGFVQQRDLVISHLEKVLGSERQGNKVYVRLASINVQDELQLRTFEIDSSSDLLKELPRNNIQLNGTVEYWCECNEYLLIRYSSGRIEARYSQQPETVIAVFYPSEVPVSDAFVVNRAEGNFLVVSVSDGTLSWFRLP